MPIPHGPQLHPYLTMVRCDDHTLQIGIVPDEAVTVTIPDSYRLEDVMWLLSRCDGTRSLDELVQLFGEGKHKVMDPEDLCCLLQELAAAGVAHLGAATAVQGRNCHNVTVGVVGKGALLEELRRLLAAEGVRIVEWRRSGSKPVDVVIVSDTIIPDPVLIHSLLRRQQPFLLCTLLDNRGVVGPLVKPGFTPPQTMQKITVPPLLSYLPALVTARLAKEAGRASRATVAATAAFAVSMLRQSVIGNTISACHEQWMVTPDAGIMSRQYL